MLDNMFLKFKDCVGYVYIWKKLLKVVLLWFDLYEYNWNFKENVEKYLLDINLFLCVWKLSG